MPIGQVLKPPVYASRPYLAATVILAAETLFPGYFALVMVTAAVSIASFLLGYSPIAHALVAAAGPEPRQMGVRLTLSPGNPGHAASPRPVDCGPCGRSRRIRLVLQ
jgi:hypothetical protein